MKSPIELLRSLLFDFKRLEPDVKGLERDLISLKKRYKHEGYGFLSVALSSLGHALQQGLSTGCFSCPMGFERIHGGTIPKLFSGMFSEVFEPLSGRVKQDLNLGTLTNLYQILFLFKKTQVSQSNELLLDEKACSEFFSNDIISSKVSFPEREKYRLGLIARFILPKLRLLDFGKIACRHGPGAVAERLTPNQKWCGVTDGIFNDSFRVKELDLDTFAVNFDSVMLAVASSSEVECIRPGPTSKRVLDYGASRSTARLVSVEKNCSSRRTITVEPLLNQFIQQGLNTMLRDSISQCSILSQCLALTDQSKNQKLALEGSLTGKWSTIDLKAASDLMSLPLVKLVFGSHEEFLHHAIDSRTTHVSHGTSVVNVCKFAGMGNALTFPIQSVVFATIALAAILDLTHVSASTRNLRRAARHIRVYGDDIIVDHRYVHQVVNWLTLFGLKVNQRKSFFEGNFKESCGVDAYKGVDITPVYLRAAPDNTSTEPNDIVSLISFANQAWMAGLYEASACVKGEVEKRLGYALPLVTSFSGSLGWFSRQEASHATRWCDKLQMMLTKAPVLQTKQRSDPLDGWPALLKFFHVPLIGRPLKHLLYTPKRYQLSISKRWLPVRVCASKDATSSNWLPS